eukprot:CAMPEP_0177628690 /NCGR_PEP_ID=MMETSP0447-20121125/266_1 /TAXON_ID=0 /ORGANISM="Stygamoeba regulata, Strain BSH-02190019" /LENGTH=653 /DNA_ID=CAMNT_0019129955 /DNA_START=118 /DNA_END=2079 /DNA_ORIENTATION=-
MWALPAVLSALALALMCVCICTAAPAPTLTFGIANDQFVATTPTGSQPVQLLSGSIHYPRVPRAYWKDRLSRMVSLGLNAVQVYVFWNVHQPTPDTFNFEGDADLQAFLQLAHEVGLMVLLRPGPYVCAEWDWGGLPSWLLRGAVGSAPPLRVRTYDDTYIAAVDAFWGELLPRVRPLLFENGGPVVAVQVENEFGSYGDVANNPDDEKYLRHLIDLARQHLGDNVLLYTTDGGTLGNMQRGSLPGSIVYTVGDFGPSTDPSGSFAAQKQMNAPGLSPPFVSEFYSGWLTHWGEKMANTSSAELAQATAHLLSLGASVNFYMGHGGTNFGFFNGANSNGDGSGYTPHITSYDYDAMISEAGTHGYGSDSQDKFEAVRAVLAPTWRPLTPPPEPPAPTVCAPPAIRITHTASLLDSLPSLAAGVWPNALLNMEALKGQACGFVAYTTTLPPATTPTSAVLTLPSLRDRVYVFVDGALQGVGWRANPATSNVTLQMEGGGGAHLTLLVENTGRVNFGADMDNEWKGMVDCPLLDGSPISTQWTTVSLPLHAGDLARAHWQAATPTAPPAGPALHRARLEGPPCGDTFVASRGWGRGVVWANGVNLGRFWPGQGPQQALFLPAPLLSQDGSDIIVLELEPAAAGAPGRVEFVASAF